jgi:hypothetical protein
MTIYLYAEYPEKLHNGDTVVRDYSKALTSKENTALPKSKAEVFKLFPYLPTTAYHITCELYDLTNDIGISAPIDSKTWGQPAQLN